MCVAGRDAAADFSIRCSFSVRLAVNFLRSPYVANSTANYVLLWQITTGHQLVAARNAYLKITAEPQLRRMPMLCSSLCQINLDLFNSLTHLPRAHNVVYQSDGKSTDEHGIIRFEPTTPRLLPDKPCADRGTRTDTQLQVAPGIPTKNKQDSTLRAD